jgi:hypothetical protein
MSTEEELASGALHKLVTTYGRKLRILQERDAAKQWWTLDEMRFCRRCEHLFLGREIRFLEDDEQVVHLRCPTFGCEGGIEDWEYPELHL